MPTKRLHPSSKGYCQCCGRWSEMRDMAHIRSKGSGGTMDESNMLLFCRLCHNFQHSQGWDALIKEHPVLAAVLKDKGFEIVEEFGVRKLRKAWAV